jgi:hypothetical protein
VRRKPNSTYWASTSATWSSAQHVFRAAGIRHFFLNLLVEWSEPLVADRTFLQLMELVERVILYSDATLTVGWAMYSTYHSIEALHDE